MPFLVTSDIVTSFGAYEVGRVVEADIGGRIASAGGSVVAISDEVANGEALRQYLVQRGKRRDALLPQSLRVSTGQMDIYVSQANGDDVNGGTVPTSPLRTYAAFAERLNGLNLQAPVVGHFGTGTYVARSLPSVTNGSRIWMTGDGAGQPGDDGFTEVVGPTALVGGTTAADFVTGGGFTANAHRFLTVEVLTGDAAGCRKTIRDHDATTFFLNAACRDLTGATVTPVPGDLFRIVRPSVLLDMQTRKVDLSAGASPLGTVESPTGIVGLANVKITGTGAGELLMSRGNYYMYGLERDGVQMGWQQAAVQSGVAGGDDTIDAADDPVADLGFAPGTHQLWRGWSYSEDPTLPGFPSAVITRRNAFVGFLNVRRLESEDSTFRVIGGAIFQPFGPAFALLLAREASLQVAASQGSDNAFAVSGATNNGFALCIVRHGAVLEGANALAITQTGTARGLAVYNGAVAILNVGSNDFISSSAGIGLDASGGGKVSFINGVVPPVTGGAGDLNVLTPAAAVPSGTLGSPGDVVADTAHTGSMIRRMLSGQF